jgi:hypothetical protein
MNALPGAIVAPLAEVAPDGRPRWELVWHGSPLSACTIQVQDGIDDFAYVGSAGMTSRLGGRDERFQNGPFLFGQITGIASSLHLPTSLPFFLFDTSFFYFPPLLYHISCLFTELLPKPLYGLSPLSSGFWGLCTQPLITNTIGY